MNKFFLTISSIVACFGLSTVAFAQKYPEGSAYSCQSPSGQYFSSDRPIPQCINSYQRVINSSGTVIAVIPPKDIAQRKKADEEKKKSESDVLERLVSKGESILEDFPNEKAHDAFAEKQLQPLFDKLKVSNNQIQYITNALTALDDPTQTKGMTPVSMRATRAQLVRDRAVQEHIASTLRQQISNINAIFQQEKGYLRPLWRGEITRLTLPEKN